MSVEFNEPPTIISTGRAKRSSSLSELVIKTGLVKTQGGAQIVLLLVAILLLAAAAMFFVHANATPPSPVLQQAAR